MLDRVCVYVAESEKWTVVILAQTAMGLLDH